MHLKSMEIRNVKSFRDQASISFNEDINILVGPNAGGKSNLLDITTVSLNEFFLKQYVEDQPQLGNRIRQENQLSNVEDHLEPYIGEEDQDSEIVIELVVSQEDLANISTIVEYKDEFTSALQSYYDRINAINQNLGFVDNWRNHEMNAGDVLNYEIVNNSLRQPPEPNNTYLTYLKKLNLFLMLARMVDDVELYPPYFYFSPYRGGIEESKEVTLHDDNYYDLLNNYLGSTSREQATAIELAIFKLAEMKREIEHSPRPNNEFFDVPEVEMIDQYFDRLGYEWELECTNVNENRYELFLEKDGKQYDMNQLSSGETEVLNFLLGILSTNIRNGLIVIDEPELHLHPRWQKVLLELVADLEERTGNQFILTTHSPHFITEWTISQVLRVYKDPTDSSRLTRVEDVGSADLRDLVHIINSHNNEKMFFADDVVLVEGIMDRLIYQALINHYLNEREEPRIIEVLEVNGKGNFEKYSDFLGNIDIPNYIIADRDYANNIPNEPISDLFETDEEKIDDRVLKDPSSKDHQTLAACLDTALESGDLDQISEAREIWTHIEQRMTHFKEDLTPEEMAEWESFLEEKAEEGIFILPNGEIEDHLPTEVNSISDAIELTKDENFQTWIESEDENTESLKEIALEIVP